MDNRAPTGPESGSGGVRRATAYRGRRRLAGIGVGVTLDNLSAVALPFVLGRAVDAIVSGSRSERWFALVAGLIVVGLAGDLLAGFAGTAYTATAAAQLRRLLVRHLLAIGPDRARRFATGDLVTRVSANATDAVQAGPAVMSMGSAVVLPVGSLILLAIIDPRVGGAFLVGITVVAFVLRGFTRRTSAAMAEYQVAQGRLAAGLAESLAGSRTVAAAGTIEREERRVLGPLADLRHYGDQTWRAVSRSAAQATVIGPLVLAVVLAVAGLGLTAGRITAGDLVAVSRYAILGVGLGGLTDALGRVARARAGRRRLNEVLAVEPVRYGHRGFPLPAPPVGAVGRLVFHGVCVHDAGAVLLDNVDLTLPGGAVVAVVGRTGAGKSVFASVAARLRDPTAGRVLLDGVPIEDLTHDALRDAVGIAFERPVLFGRTVGEAIGAGRGGDSIRSSAGAMQAHDFIAKLPRGYETPLAQAPMSGGEVQRLGLTRAWRASRVLVLDDATSSVDTITELRIGRALRSSRRGRTQVIVTHRARTAARADLVVWLDNGRVRDSGPHHLLWQDADYRAVFG